MYAPHVLHAICNCALHAQWQTIDCEPNTEVTSSDFLRLIYTFYDLTHFFTVCVSPVSHYQGVLQPMAEVVLPVTMQIILLILSAAMT